MLKIGHLKLALIITYFILIVIFLFYYFYYDFNQYINLTYLIENKDVSSDTRDLIPSSKSFM